jgi:hypothetical protein
LTASPDEDRQRLLERAEAMMAGAAPYEHDGPNRVAMFGDGGWEDYPGGGDLDPNRRDGAQLGWVQGQPGAGRLRPRAT